MPASTSKWTLDEEIADLQLGDFSAQVRPGMPMDGMCPINFGNERWVQSLFGLADDRVKLQLQQQYVREPDLFTGYASSNPSPFETTSYWRIGDWCPDALDRKTATVELIHSVATPLLDQAYQPRLITKLDQRSRLLRESTGAHCEDGDCSLFGLSDLVNDSSETWIDLSSIESTGDQQEIGRFAGSSLLVYRVPNVSCLALLVHPSDASTCNIRVDRDRHQWIVEHELQKTALEKGVIRRFRAAAAMFVTSNATDVQSNDIRSDSETEFDLSLAMEWAHSFCAHAPPLTT